MDDLYWLSLRIASGCGSGCWEKTTNIMLIILILAIQFQSKKLSNVEPRECFANMRCHSHSEIGLYPSKSVVDQ